MFRKSVKHLVGLWLAHLLVASAHLQGAPTVLPVGRFDFVDNTGSGARELSGITWLGGNRYLAVNDESSIVHPMTIHVDANTGAISSAQIDPAGIWLRDANGLPLTGTDLEGIVSDGQRLWVSNESGPRITMHDQTTGIQQQLLTTSSHPTLGVFQNIVANRSWESLTRRVDGSQIWTANEEALTVDGPPATTTLGTVVRLQQFDGNLNPTRQWAYRTEPIPGSVGSGQERSGVADMLALDDGNLLVMERGLGLGFRIGLYLVQGATATDVSQPPFQSGLIGKTYTAATKVPLWASTFPNTTSNFEGATLGPTLADGSRSIILVRDNGSGSSHSLFALRLIQDPPVAVHWQDSISGYWTDAARWSTAAVPQNGAPVGTRYDVIMDAVGGAYEVVLNTTINVRQLSLQTGILTGEGTLVGDVTNAAVVSPGGAAVATLSLMVPEPSASALLTFGVAMLMRGRVKYMRRPGSGS